MELLRHHDFHQHQSQQLTHLLNDVVSACLIGAPKRRRVSEQIIDPNPRFHCKLRVHSTITNETTLINVLIHIKHHVEFLLKSQIHDLVSITDN